MVGENAFAHESGIHQHGMIEFPLTYEVMRPEDVGFKSNSLVLGKHSGRHALASRLRDLGYELEPAQIDQVFEELKKLADKKKEIYDGDLEALLVGLFHQSPADSWTLVSLTAASGTGTPPSAAVRLQRRGGRAGGGGRHRRRAGGRGVQVHRPHHRGEREAARLPALQRQRRRGRAGRGHGGRGVGGPALPRPRGGHRHRRRQRAGLPRGGQPHRRRTASAA